MNRKSVRKQIAEDLCEINCWRTPKRLKMAFKRELSEEECSLAMEVLQAYVPEKEWVRVWKLQDMGKYE